MTRHSYYFLKILVFIAGFPCLLFPQNKPTNEYTYMIINTYPHDHQAYTQGLVFYDGFLYESTGRRGESTLRKTDLSTGAVVKSVALDEEFFGEGLTIAENRLIQLTWESYIGLVYDLNTFALLEQFYYSTEGWGLTYDGTNLIMSDGSANLYFLDKTNFAVIRQITVSDQTGFIRNLNELEYIQGEIYANVMPSNRIARIDPITGKVNSWINLDGLLETAKISSETNVLNGIAYDRKNERLFVTGKLWPLVFEIRIIPKGESF